MGSGEVDGRRVRRELVARELDRDRDVPPTLRRLFWSINR